MKCEPEKTAGIQKNLRAGGLDFDVVRIMVRKCEDVAKKVK